MLSRAEIQGYFVSTQGLPNPVTSVGYKKIKGVHRLMGKTGKHVQIFNKIDQAVPGDGDTEEGTNPIRKGAGVFLGAGDRCPEQEVPVGMNQTEKRGNNGGSRSNMSRGKKTWCPWNSDELPAIRTAGI